jgi:hypothetical protein
MSKCDELFFQKKGSLWHKYFVLIFEVQTLQNFATKKITAYDCEKEFSYLHSGKYLVQMMSTLLASTCCFPFDKIILSNNVINYGWEVKTYMYTPYVSKMCICDNKFWFSSVKSGNIVYLHLSTFQMLMGNLNMQLLDYFKQLK